MSARVEAAAAEWGRIKGLSPRPVDVRQMHTVLAAADAVMFSDEAVERAAISLCVASYPMTEGFWADVDGEYKEKCRTQVRAVIAALKGAHA